MITEWKLDNGLPPLTIRTQSGAWFFIQPTKNGNFFISTDRCMLHKWAANLHDIAELAEDLKKIANGEYNADR